MESATDETEQPFITAPGSVEFPMGRVQDSPPSGAVQQAARAFEAPQLVMSTDRVLRSRRFSVTLTMGTAVASQFTEFDIMRAGLSTKCRREDDLATNITSCFCSGGKRVVEVGISSKAAFGPFVSADGLVTFVFDNCRSNCSSSRDHHKSRLMLVMDELPGRSLVISSSFVLQAREKQVRGRNKRPENEVPMSSPDNGAPLVKRLREDGPAAETPSMKALVACAAEDSSGAGARIPFEPSCPFRMMVRVHTTAITAPAVDNLLEVFKPRITGMNGYRGYRWRAMPGFAVTFSMFHDSEGVFNSLSAAKKFIRNEDENPYHADLADKNILCLISYCTSW